MSGKKKKETRLQLSMVIKFPNRGQVLYRLFVFHPENSTIKNLFLMKTE